jgi:hypothetical protein
MEEPENLIVMSMLARAEKERNNIQRAGELYLRLFLLTESESRFAYLSEWKKLSHSNGETKNDE